MKSGWRGVGRSCSGWSCSGVLRRCSALPCAASPSCCLSASRACSLMPKPSPLFLSLTNVNLLSLLQAAAAALVSEFDMAALNAALAANGLPPAKLTQAPTVKEVEEDKDLSNAASLVPSMFVAFGAVLASLFLSA